MKCRKSKDLFYWSYIITLYKIQQRGESFPARTISDEPAATAYSHESLNRNIQSVKYWLLKPVDSFKIFKIFYILNIFQLTWATSDIIFNLVKTASI